MYKTKIDRERKNIEINYKFINCGDFFRLIDQIDNIDGWTIHFDFEGKGKKCIKCEEKKRLTICEDCYEELRCDMLAAMEYD